MRFEPTPRERAFAAWLLWKMAYARKDARQAGTIDLPTEWQRLADKIAAGWRGEQGSDAAPPSGTAPAAPSKQEIDRAIDWIRHNASYSPSGQRALKVVETLAADLRAARAALRWVSNEYLPNRHDWPKEHDAALRAALAERP